MGACLRLPWLCSRRHCRVLPVRFGGGNDRLSVSFRNQRSLYPPHSNAYHRPNVGGVVGLADLYVDPALGFSLGWAAWVCIVFCSRVQPANHCSSILNWSVVLRKWRLGLARTSRN